MSSEKKRIRQAFRDAVFKRDSNACRVCFIKRDDLDAHHITDRNLMPNGGYAASNGISLCPVHHEMAEVFHSTGTPVPGFSPNDLYILIGSSYDLATKDSKRLG
jgi:predicted restriction endonuclease